MRAKDIESGSGYTPHKVTVTAVTGRAGPMDWQQRLDPLPQRFVDLPWLRHDRSTSEPEARTAQPVRAPTN
jgi:hypothetical protein